MEAMKTPGVYIVEKNAFPNSVVPVATAVPAFIGHTEKAMNGTKSLLNVPFRITSMLEYNTYFGGPPLLKYTLTKVDDIKNTDFVLGGIAYHLEKPTVLYTFYYHMVLFFANGGGSCYIVSEGDYNTSFSEDAFEKGITALEKEQEPTMLVIPEAVNMGTEDYYKIKTKSLKHCGDIKRNRVAILDIYNGYKPQQDPDGNVINDFRENVGSLYLDFTVAYYPWINTSVVSESDVKAANLSDITPLISIITQDSNWKSNDKIANSVYRFELELAYAEIDKSTKTAEEKEQEKKDICLQTAKQDKITILKAEELRADKSKPTTDEDYVTAADETLVPLKPEEKATLADTLLPGSGKGKQVMKEVCKTMNLLPPSAAMAGIYTKTDNARGVWKAPANVSVNMAVSPAVNLTDDAQANLNVDINGRSINAIRYFKGEGVKVWGARTLDGNSGDWRYINVRRTMLFLEESVKNAARAYVFEPNVASTWLTMKSMIENFLMGVWKQGGLAGASPEDAYSVHVGLGDTMTAEDILEGILRITVLVAISHPAEFIEITFQQQMQKS